MDKYNDQNIPRIISSVRFEIRAYLQSELNKSGFESLVPSHGDLIFSLIKYGDMTMTELAKTIARDRATVTSLVSKLEKLGIVAYTINPNDARSKKIMLTPKGKKLDQKFVSISENMNDILWRNISDNQKDMFMEVLLKIKDNFDTQ